MEFEALVQKLNPKLKLIAHKLNGRYTTFSDEDLYQEAVLSLWQKHQAGETSDKTESFLVQGAYFLMKNYIRSAYKTADQHSLRLNNFIHSDGLTYEESFFPDESEKMFTEIDCQVDADNLKKNLNSREKLVLDWLGQGLATREIGARLGVSHVMVSKIVKKIKEKCTAGF